MALGYPQILQLAFKEFIRIVWNSYEFVQCKQTSFEALSCDSLPVKIVVGIEKIVCLNGSHFLLALKTDSSLALFCSRRKESVRE